MLGLAGTLLAKLGIRGALMLGAAALCGYLWWMWDIEKRTVIELRTSLGKMEVINVSSQATIKELQANNARKDKLHADDVDNIKDELGERDDRIAELRKQNKFLFDRAVKKPLETGDAINARHHQWMCRLYYREDCPSTADSGEDTVSPTSPDNAEADNNSNDNSDN